MREALFEFTKRTMSRKFWLTVGILLVATGLVVADVITSSIWGDVVKWVITVYVAGNVSERLKWLKNDDKG